MISNKIQRLKYVLSDYIASNLAILIFNIARFHILEQWNFGYSDLYTFLFSQNLILEQILIPIIILVINYYCGYYNLPFQKSNLKDLFSTFLSCGISAIIIYFALLTNDQVKLRATNYELILTLFSTFFIVLLIGRSLITSYTTKKLKSKKWVFKTLIIGNSANAHKMASTLTAKSSSMGYDIHGFVNIPNETCINTTNKTYDIDDIENICKKHSINTIIIAPENEQEKITLSLLFRLFPLQIPIKISPDTISLMTSRIRLNSIYEEPLIDITTADINESTKNIKRLIDIIISLIALVILFIPMLIVALAIKIDSKGPVFYSQERVGYKQKKFNILKFRSMTTDAEKSGPQLSSENDSRITKLGRILRKYRIDELPQFWNVLKGDMSLVGPRPEREYFIHKIVEKAPYYTLVHQVRPGITSWGMVKYGYAKNVDEMILRLRYDLIYLTNISILVDLKIIIYTVKTVFTGRGM